MKLFLSKVMSPSFRILESSFDIALLSTDKKSASCWRLNGIVNEFEPESFDWCDKYEINFSLVVRCEM